jgi:hypothetical protein
MGERAGVWGGSITNYKKELSLSLLIIVSGRWERGLGCGGVIEL